MRDLQRSKVYAWERKNIAPHDLTPVAFHNVKAIVDYVWKSEGLLYPPLVESMPKQNKTAAGDAFRYRVRFTETTHTWIILHELAHSMTSDIDGNSNQHGSLFMSVYISLVSRYLKIPYATLRDTAAEAGLVVAEAARPVFC
jgi:hypothetical protein